MNAPTAQTDPVVAIRDDQAGTEAALKALAAAGFDMAKVSLVGKGHRTEEHAHGFYALGDRVRTWGATGGLWGVAWGMLLGAAIFVMPPVGVVAAAGPIAAALVAALEGAVVVGGVSALCVALAEGGMTHDQAKKYEADIAAGRFLVIVNGSPEDAARARGILANPAASAGHAIHIIA